VRKIKVVRWITARLCDEKSINPKKLTIPSPSATLATTFHPLRDNPKLGRAMKQEAPSGYAVVSDALVPAAGHLRIGFTAEDVGGESV
jgi:hypothetical protein